MTKVVERVIAAWQRNGAVLNPGASEAELDGLRSLLDCELPEDLRAFYGLANGMPDLEYDEHWVSFWSIAKMRAEHQLWGDGELGFADFLLDSWRFIFRIKAGRLIVVSQNVPPGAPLEELGTWSDFLELYLTKPASLRII